jgi:integrase
MEHQDLQSEQLPTDGSYQIRWLLKEANKELKENGRHGKTCTLVAKIDNLSYQFNFGKQQNRGSGYKLNKQGILDAKRIATIISNQLAANQFSWEWFDGLLGKKVETEKVKTCHEMITEFKAHWFRENKSLKNPESSWYGRFKYLDKVLIDNQDGLNEKNIKATISETDNNTSIRASTLQALNLFLQYHRIKEFDELINGYQARNNPKPKAKHIPSDKEIKHVFDTGFNLDSIRQDKWKHRAEQWQFLYGLLAVYGLRIHEAWHIANWDKPVVLRKGDWVAVSFDVDAEEDKLEQYFDEECTIPAILDPANTSKVLCIKHGTKTGYRMAIPISPLGSDWLKEFELISEFNLPDVKNALKHHKLSSASCTQRTCERFKRCNYGFTPHALRHAYNHRCHQLGINPTVIARSMGHSLQMNQTTYLNSMSQSRELEMIKDEIEKDKVKRDRINELEDEVKALKRENERLRTELKMYEALKQDN